MKTKDTESEYVTFEEIAESAKPTFDKILKATDSLSIVQQYTASAMYFIALTDIAYSHPETEPLGNLITDVVIDKICEIKTGTTPAEIVAMLEKIGETEQ